MCSNVIDVSEQFTSPFCVYLSRALFHFNHTKAYYSLDHTFSPFHLSIIIPPFQPLFEDLQQNEPAFRSLVHTGQSLVDTTSGTDKDKYSKRIKDITDRYNKVNRSVRDRHDMIKTVLPMVRDHYNNNKIVEDVIKQTEPVLQSIQSVGIEPERGVQQIHKIRVGFKALITVLD